MDNNVTPEENVYGTLESAVNYAWQAYHGNDWPASYSRWERIRKTWPNYPPPYVHAATSLSKIGRNKKAESLLKKGLQKFPGEPQIALEYAWRLYKNGNYAGSTAQFESAIKCFPNNPEFGIDFLKIAIEDEDFKEALRRAALISSVYPKLISESRSVRDMMAHAQLYAQFELIASDQADHLLMVTGREKADLNLIGTQELMLCFEGLGENCEFGLVQRHFGVEPLGLLRWAATSPGNLARALNETFSGVGQLDQSNLVKIHGEYMTTDNCYGMGSHTFIKVNEAKEEQIWKDLIKRLQYLRRKLIEDLKSGSKICVYHCENGASMEEVTELHKAIGGYGSRYLLYVRISDNEHPPGTLKVSENGLMIGYINRLGPDRRSDGDHWNISYDLWLALCKQAYQTRFRAEQSA